MARQRLVAVSYPVDYEFARINTEVVGGDASLAFLAPLAGQERLGILREAYGGNGRRLAAKDRWVAGSAFAKASSS